MIATPEQRCTPSNGPTDLSPLHGMLNINAVEEVIKRRDMFRAKEIKWLNLHLRDFPARTPPKGVSLSQWPNTRGGEAQKEFRGRYLRSWHDNPPDVTPVAFEKLSLAAFRVLRVFKGHRLPSLDGLACDPGVYPPAHTDVHRIRQSRMAKEVAVKKKGTLQSLWGKFALPSAKEKEPALPMNDESACTRLEPDTAGDGTPFVVPTPALPSWFLELPGRNDLPLSDHTTDEGCAWWVRRAGNERGLRATTGLSPPLAEEFFVKYGDGLLSREELFEVFMELKILCSCPDDAYPTLLNKQHESESTIRRRIEKNIALLFQVVSDVAFDDISNEWNHCPHYPYHVMGHVDTVPVCSCVGATSDVAYQPKYASSVYKLIVAVDNLGRVMFVKGPDLGSRYDGNIWSTRCPWKLMPMCCYMLGDGAFSGCPRIIAPTRKPSGAPLPKAASGYNDVHSFYRARIETFFGYIWSWSLIRNTWRGRAEHGEHAIHQRLHLLVNLAAFVLNRRLKHEPFGPWPHLPHPDLVPRSGTDSQGECEPAPNPNPNPSNNQQPRFVEEEEDLQIPEEDPLQDDDCTEFDSSSYYNRPITRGMSQALYAPPRSSSKSKETVCDVEKIVRKVHRNGEVNYVVRIKGREASEDCELPLNRVKELPDWAKLLDDFQQMEMCQSLQLGLRIRGSEDRREH